VFVAYTTPCLSHTHLCAQVLTRFSTNRTLNAIRDYNSMAFIAKSQDISYALGGEITHNPLADINAQYDFPLDRATDPLSLMEQCHSIMRARTFSHPAIHVEPPETTSGSRRKLITLEAIMHYVQEGVEWKPLNTNTSRSDKMHLSRKEIVRVINEYARHMPLNILYDSRFVSYDSNFCENNIPEPVPRPQTLRFASPRARTDILYSLDQHLTEMNAIPHNNYNLSVFGMQARTMGNIEKLCPCEFRSAAHAANVACTIPFKICDVGQHESGSDRAFFDKVLSGCMAEGRTDSAAIVYPAIHNGYVRSLLYKYSVFLKNSGFVCSTMQPSDLWGLGISHFNTTNYIDSEHRGNLDLDVGHMLLHPKSGVSLLNYHHVVENVHTVLSEGDREVSACLMYVDTKRQTFKIRLVILCVYT